MNQDRIGDLLIKYTTLTKEQLEECVALQSEEGGRLGDILLRKKYVLPHEIMRALCAQIDLAYVEDLKANEIDPTLVDKIPINYARTREVLPLEFKDNILTVAVSDPFNLESLEDIRIIFNCPTVNTVVTSPARIQDAINRVYERNTSNMIQDIDKDDEENYDLEGPIDILDATEDEAPVIRFVNSVIFRAVKEKASDIHIEPFEKEVVIRFRVDGIMHDILHQPRKVHAAVSSRVKVMGNLDIAEKRIPQDGRIFRKVAGKEIDIRLSTIPTQFGERIVMRILEKGGKLLSLEGLGFEGETLEQVNKLVHRENGIILITGPTGSGKSTTMAACLERINTNDINILTVEDPIEYQLNGVGQVQVNAKINLTFASALRSFLRQDPDVIMVGEIRDTETADLAVTAALTGHLVFSSLHTNEAAGSFPRLIDMGVEPFLVASSVNGVLAQRLVRRVCLKCRESYEASPLELQELGIKNLQGPITLFKAVGCQNCNQTGYSGRINVHELLIMDDTIRTLVMKNSDSGSIRKAAMDKGMLTMWEDGARKVLSGVTTLQELTRSLNMDE
ncbi:MAG: type II secretion system ATPase GspE [Oligoflexia bacterium]|nr:type II secretion system ATPase GspE [Oligoflexia bacterium]